MVIDGGRYAIGCDSGTVYAETVGGSCEKISTASAAGSSVVPETAGDSHTMLMVSPALGEP
jgi:hypothetical protein